jgi:two-component system, OmpR family, response regulator
MSMLPTKLALIDDDPEYADILSGYLRDRGIHVDVFPDSNDMLARDDSFEYDFYVVDLMLPGADGVELIKVIRRRSDAGLLVVSGRLAPDVFQQVITAGADMFLAKPVQCEQIELGIKAVSRRIGNPNSRQSTWLLDRTARHLVAPDGARVLLNDTDLALAECFLEARGDVVARETLRHRLGQDTGPDGTDSLNATIYRLRRRIERATPSLVPLQAKSRVGYVFRAPLKAV